MSTLETIAWIVLLICFGALAIVTVLVAIFMLNKED